MLADKLLAAASALARDVYGKPVCVSVCDAFGFLIAFSRMDGAPVRCLPTCKAARWALLV
jgi:uncharacterized protein GlcG (DUF336 family)